MSNETDKAKHTDHSDPRLRQLLDKAREGDETAVHSLWTEFGIDYAKEGGRYE